MMINYDFIKAIFKHLLHSLSYTKKKHLWYYHVFYIVEKALMHRKCLFNVDGIIFFKEINIYTVNKMLLNILSLESAIAPSVLLLHSKWKTG